MSATNGVPPASSSAFISHLNSYPAVNDGVTYFKGQPLGQKSIEVYHSVYETFIKPFSPYIAKANGYASPYVSKADHLADSGLDQVDQRFPIVKEPTDKIKGKIHDTVQYPRKKASDIFTVGSEFIFQQKDFVLRVYEAEYNKAGGEQKGYAATAKASFTTTLGLSAQFLGWISSFLASKKEEAKAKLNEKVHSS